MDSIGTPVDRVCPKNGDRLESSVTFLGMGGVRISESLECETYIVIVEFGTTDRKIPWTESLPNERVLLIRDQRLDVCCPRGFRIKLLLVILALQMLIDGSESLFPNLRTQDTEVSNRLCAVVSDCYLVNDQAEMNTRAMAASVSRQDGHFDVDRFRLVK